MATTTSAGGCTARGRRSSGCSRCTSGRRRRRCRRGLSRRRVPHRRQPGDDRSAAMRPCSATAALAGGVPVTGFSLADLHALAPDPDALASLCSRAARRRARSDRRGAGRRSTCSTLPAMRSARRATRGCGVWRLTVHGLRRTSARIADPSSARAISRTTVGGFRAFAPLPRTMSVTEPTTGYDDVKQVALARVVVDQHRVDSGRLAALRSKAGAGRADRRRRRRRWGCGRGSGRPRHAPQPDRGNQGQHPRRRRSSRSSATVASASTQPDAPSFVWARSTT